MSLSGSQLKAIGVVFGSLTAAAISLRMFLPRNDPVPEAPRGRGIRETLPSDLSTWRQISTSEEARRVWEATRSTLYEAGVYLWHGHGSYSKADPSTVICSSGFAYVTPTRGEKWANHFQYFSCQNELTRCGTTLGGLNVVIRVVVIGDEGKQHLRILRKLARGTRSLLTENHVIPLWNEASLEDITFTISPYVGHPMDECYGFWANNSVGDIVDMILQALEAIVFVHGLGIVHRDLCKHNYVVQWHPESLSTMRVPLHRPRAFLIDFENAHEFPPEVTSEQRLLCGLPAEGYRRPVPPEIASGGLYDPFKADVWQLAESFSDFETTIPELDSILAQMRALDVSVRLSATEGRDKLAAAIHNIAPVTLLIPPMLLNPLFTS